MNTMDTGETTLDDTTLQHVALAYVDHPDYKAAWRP
jgi:hypothetical protein